MAEVVARTTEGTKGHREKTENFILVEREEGGEVVVVDVHDSHLEIRY